MERESQQEWKKKGGGEKTKEQDEKGDSDVHTKSSQNVQ